MRGARVRPGLGEPMLEQLGKTILLVAAVLAVAGLLLWGLGKIGFRGLPGDVRYETEHFRFYFPIVTCLVLSVILTLLAWLWSWLHRG